MLSGSLAKDEGFVFCSTESSIKKYFNYAVGIFKRIYKDDIYTIIHLIEQKGEARMMVRDIVKIGGSHEPYQRYNVTIGVFCAIGQISVYGSMFTTGESSCVLLDAELSKEVESLGLDPVQLERLLANHLEKRALRVL